jgi:tRNA modification GTPase
MEWLYSNEPIIACSTGQLENTAISVIRASGFDNLMIFKGFFDKDPEKFCPHRTIFCHLLDPADSSVVDQVVCTYFKGPKSYNGENILEISVHGNRFNVAKILKLFVDSQKFRKAAPGEFTYRALKNKKLSLSQVEGLDLLLNASSSFALDQGLQILCGDVNQKYLELKELYLSLRSNFELNIDFVEDVGEEVAEQKFKEAFFAFESVVNQLYKRVGSNTAVLLRPEIALYGAVNAGKSSLFNELLSSDRSIVSDTKGTTRDYISEGISYKSVEYSLIDTAGLRTTSDEIEYEGIRRGRQKIENAFFKILVINPFEKPSKDDVIDDPDVVVFTHCDLNDFDKAVARSGFSHHSYICVSLTGPIEPLKSGPIEPLKSGPIEPAKSGPIEPAKSGPIEPAKRGPIEPAVFSRNQIFTVLFDAVSEKYSLLIKDQPLLLERHSDLIQKIQGKTEEFSKLLKSNEDLGIISNEINRLGVEVEELVGSLPPDQVLGNIFENFCIGK